MSFPTQRHRVEQLLRNAGPAGVTTADFLAAHIPRFSARVQELRDSGRTIRTERLREGSYRYTLLSGTALPASTGAGMGGEPAPRLFESSSVRSAVTGNLIGGQE